MPAVLAENDESPWSDETGVLYHYPRRYAAMLPPGEPVVFYKGRMKDPTFASQRLSPDPHYFGLATIGQVYPDPASSKGDLFATLDNFQRFAKAVPFKLGGAYLETIPANRKANYWRDGVRAIDAATFATIVGLAGATVDPLQATSGTYDPDSELESGVEGNKTLRYVTTYERDPRYRRQALAIHGTRCKACDVDMGEKYGTYAEGLIHVHHVVPVSTYDAPRKIDPGKELVPVCPNCHAVIHRKKATTLSIADVRRLLGKA